MTTTTTAATIKTRIRAVTKNKITLGNTPSLYYKTAPVSAGERHRSANPRGASEVDGRRGARLPPSRRWLRGPSGGRHGLGLAGGGWGLRFEGLFERWLGQQWGGLACLLDRDLFCGRVIGLSDSVVDSSGFNCVKWEVDWVIYIDCGFWLGLSVPFCSVIGLAVLFDRLMGLSGLYFVTGSPIKDWWFNYF